MPHSWESNWQIERKLGVGGQGIAQLVKSTDGKAQIGVLKYLKNNRNPTSRIRMKSEVACLEFMHSLKARVPGVIDHNTDKYLDEKEELYLVMEFIEGQTLQEYVSTGVKIDLNAAIDITLSLCEVLKIGHDEGLLHRDIKPDNLILSGPNSSDIFVVDYGLAFNSESNDDVTQVDETFRNKFLDLPENNTPGGNMRDPRSDITYACGVFYFLLTNHRPGHLSNETGNMPHMREGYAVRQPLKEDSRCRRVEMMLNRGFTSNISLRFENIESFSNALKAIRETGDSKTIDPITLANDLSEDLLKNDRKTQLFTLGSVAQSTLNSFTKLVASKYRGNLGRFTLGNVNQSGGSINDPNIDLVGPIQTYTLGSQNHKIYRYGYFRFLAKGMQLIFARAVSSNKDPGRIPNPPADGWKEFAWFEIDQTEGVAEAGFENFESWLVESMQDISDEIMQ